MTHKELRKLAKQKLGKYKSMEVTWKKFDCGLSDDGLQNGCGECEVCKYNNFLDLVHSIATQGTCVEYNKFIDEYQKIVYAT